MKTLKIRLEPTTATYLVCICCGGFRTEYAILPVNYNTDCREPMAGVHKKCIPLMHVRRASATTSEASQEA